MKQILAKSRKVLFLAFVCYALCAIIETFFAVTLGYVVDDAQGGSQSQLIWHVILAAVLLLVSLAVYLGAFAAHKEYARRCVSELKNNLMGSIFRRGLLSYCSNSDSYYLNLLSGDADTVETDYLQPRPLLLFYIAESVFSLAAMIYISWKATLLFILFFLIPIFVPQLLSSMLARQKKTVSEENERFTFALKEQIQGLAEIVENLSVTHFFRKFAEANSAQQKAKKAAGITQNFAIQLSVVSGLIAQLCCFGVGGILVIHGEMSIGMLIAAIQLINSVIGPINGISQVMVQIKGAEPIVEKMNGELSVEPEPESESASLSGDIRYDDVSVQYGEDSPIVEHFTHTFCAGKTYAIIGDSGKGKTTLLKCLLKLHENYCGNVFVGDRNVRDISSADIFRYIGYVPQNAYLFNDTIEENITMGTAYPASAVRTVLEKTGLRKLADKNRGSLGDSGAEISGGERQRIILARSLIRSPHILVFDEPTTSLDPANRDSVNDLIFSLKDYTRIVITHDRRPEYLVHFDEVISI